MQNPPLVGYDCTPEKNNRTFGFLPNFLFKFLAFFCARTNIDIDEKKHLLTNSSQYSTSSSEDESILEDVDVGDGDHNKGSYSSDYDVSFTDSEDESDVHCYVLEHVSEKDLLEDNKSSGTFVSINAEGFDGDIEGAIKKKVT